MNNKQGTSATDDTPEGMVFPCEIDIKVFVNNDAQAKAIISEVIVGYVGQANLRGVRERPSSKGNYLGLSCLVYAEDRDSIDKVYQALSDHPAVKLLI